MSQNLQFEYTGSLANLPGNNNLGATKVGVIQKLQHNFGPANGDNSNSKRSYENTHNFDKKGNNSILKSKFVSVNIN